MARELLHCLFRSLAADAGRVVAQGHSSVGPVGRPTGGADQSRRRHDRSPRRSGERPDRAVPPPRQPGHHPRTGRDAARRKRAQPGARRPALEPPWSSALMETTRDGPSASRARRLCEPELQLERDWGPEPDPPLGSQGRTRRRQSTCDRPLRCRGALDPGWLAGDIQIDLHGCLGHGRGTLDFGWAGALAAL